MGGIRFIDFGLSELCDGENGFVCDKFVGKMSYKAPKIHKREIFFANKADIFSLGVCLFMMTFGAPPFARATDRDASFCVLKAGQMDIVLKQWKRWEYIKDDQYDLLMKMMCVDEAERPSIDEIMQHKWIKSYFVKDQNGLIYSKQSKSIKECDAVLEKSDCKLNSIPNNEMKKLLRSQSDISLVKTLKMAKKEMIENKTKQKESAQRRSKSLNQMNVLNSRINFN